MDDIDDNGILAEAIADVAFDVFSRIGNDPDARYAFFKRLVVTSPQFSVAIWNWSKGLRILSIWLIRQIEWATVAELEAVDRVQTNSREPFWPVGSSRE